MRASFGCPELHGLGTVQPVHERTTTGLELTLRRILMVLLLQVMSACGASAFTAPAMVKDINPGSVNSSPLILYPVGGKLFFSASDGVNGSEPWVSDGTAAGTFMLGDIYPGPTSSINVTCQTCNAVSDGTIVYFSAGDGTAGAQLWRTDGTSAGTTKVFTGSNAYGLGIVGNKLFFTSNSTLYTSDGTPGGTAQVAPGWLSGGSELLGIGGIAYYSGADCCTGNELWRSDGTQAGTFRVKDINPGGSDSNPTNLTNVGGTLYFTASNGAGGALYKSDGTLAGTVLLRQGGTVGGPIGERKQLPNVNGIVYFAGNEATHGSELWRSDGTPAGTYMVKDIYPGAAGSLVGSSSSIVVVGSTIFFGAADNNEHGYELWKSDGTEAGTVMVKDIDPATFSGSTPRELANINGRLFFRAKGSPAAGDQPWTSDGTEAGTQQFASIRPANFSGASTFTLAGGNLFFAANDGTHGLELWAAGPTLGVAPAEPAGSLALSQSQPNPVRSLSTITYAIAAGQHVTLKLFDTQGREVRTLVNQMQAAGQHRANLDARGLANGIYFYRLSTGSGVLERKLVIQH